MVTTPCTVSLGRAIEFYNRVKSNDPTNAVLTIVLLKVSVADDALADFDDLAALIADAGNTEADFTNYARIELSDAELAALPSPDDTNNRREIDIPDQTFTNAGGATNNSLVKLLICYDSDSGAGTDSDIIPISQHDFVVTTDGTDLVATIDTLGFYRAQR